MRKEVAVERDTESGEEEVRVEEEEIEIIGSITSKPDGDKQKHKRSWTGPVRLVADTGPLDGVDGTAAFLLTKFSEKNLFHLLVPREDKVTGVSRIEHYTQARSIFGKWRHVATLQPPNGVAGTKITAVAFVQSSQKKLEVVAHVTPLNQGENYLVGYELDLAAPSPPLSYQELSDERPRHQVGWSSPFKLATATGPIGVTGSPIIIESTSGNKHLFHLLVPTKDVIVHYTLPVGSFSHGKWESIAQLNSFQGLPVTAVSLVENVAGGFEAVTFVLEADGGELVVGYERQPGATQWSDGVALKTKDGPIVAGQPTKKPTRHVDEKPTWPADEDSRGSLS